MNKYDDYIIPDPFPLQLGMLGGVKSHALCVMFSVLYTAMRSDRIPYLNSKQLSPAEPIPVRQEKICLKLQDLGYIKNLQIDKAKQDWVFTCKIAYKPDRSKSYLVPRNSFNQGEHGEYNALELKLKLQETMRRFVYEYLLDRNGFIDISTIRQAGLVESRTETLHLLRAMGVHKQLQLGVHTYYVKPDQPIGEQYVREERKAILNAGGTKIMRISKITELSPKVILRCLYDLYGDWASFELSKDT